MTNLLIIHVWLASIVLTLFPPARKFPNNEAAQQLYIERVNSIVEDITKIEYDSTHQPWFSGKYARAREAALVAIISAEESGGYDEAVEAGTKRGDNGASWCFMAINIGKGKTVEGWTGMDLIQDRTKCFMAGINIMQRSMNACRGFGFLSGLSAYNTGRCIKNESISVNRLSRVMRFTNTKVSLTRMFTTTRNIQNSNLPIACANNVELCNAIVPEDSIVLQEKELQNNSENKLVSLE